MPFYDFSPWLGAYLKNEMNHKYALWSILHGFPIKEGHTNLRQPFFSVLFSGNFVLIFLCINHDISYAERISRRNSFTEE